MRISKEKKERISEQILSYLFSVYPKSIFTAYIAKEIIRDEEFTKKLLLDLRKKKLVIEIKKNPQGITYIRRSRWMLGREVYKAYKEHQNF
jgi:predicted transcriptional regulator with HTH domain